MLSPNAPRLPPDRSSPERPISDRLPLKLLRSADQAVVAIVVVASLCVMGIYLLRQGGLHGRLIELDQAQPQIVQFKVDINTAGLAELTQLPQIGETLATRIIEYRQANGPFTTHEQLRRVRGIGPRTYEKIEPFLLPIGSGDAVGERKE